MFLFAQSLPWLLALLCQELCLAFTKICTEKLSAISSHLIL